MPKPNLGKTDTIKKRTVYIYLPTEEMVESWKRKAREAGVSLSKFIIERVEDSIRKEEDASYLTRTDLISRIRELESQIRSLREENKTLKLAIQALENELKRYRSGSFLSDHFQGDREYDRELVEFLKKVKRPVSDNEILSHFGVDPSDSETIKVITRQLERLERYGLIQFTGRGWLWRG
jgi:predicted RNase H-like nuclease (RuvC/YqgF family)